MTFWKGRRVLITGHTGFKGGWLSLWLQTLGADLLGFSLAPSTTPNFYTLAKVSKGMTSIIGDLRDFAEIQKITKEFKPEIVIHMAAQALVQHSYKEPIETYSTNVMGTVHILEAIRQIGTVKAVINVTTDKCYENQEWAWGYRENDRLGGYDPYSNSKACSELVTSSYRAAYFIEKKIGLASARAGNVIGGGDWSPNRLVPDLVRACMDNQRVSIRNPQALRPWQHVLDPLRGYLQLAECLYKTPERYAESWNFGPREADIKPVSWIADYLTKNWGEGKSWALDKHQHPHEATYLKLDCSKARSRLDWQPHWNLERGLQETIAWYQAYQAGKDMHNISLSQLNHFKNESNIHEPCAAPALG